MPYTHSPQILSGLCHFFVQCLSRCENILSKKSILSHVKICPAFQKKTCPVSFAHFTAMKTRTALCPIQFCKIRTSVKFIVKPLRLTEHADSLWVVSAAPRKSLGYRLSMPAVGPETSSCTFYPPNSYTEIFHCHHLRSGLCHFWPLYASLARPFVWTIDLSPFQRRCILATFTVTEWPNSLPAASCAGLLAHPGCRHRHGDGRATGEG